MTVTGAGSTWINSATLDIGYQGLVALLNVTAGGSLSNGGDAYLGHNSYGAGGTATVSGNSTWTNGGAIYMAPAILPNCISTAAAR